MNKRAGFVLFFRVFLLFSVSYCFLKRKDYLHKKDAKMIKKILPWFSHMVNEISDVECIKNDILKDYQELIDDILRFKDVPINEANAVEFFVKTYYKIDRVMYDIGLKFNYFGYYNLLGSDEKIKKEIQKAYNDINTFVLNNYTYNYDIYEILKNVAEAYLKTDIAKDEVNLIEKTLDNYRRIGIYLSDEKKTILKDKNILLDDLCLQFQLNIQGTKNHIIVSYKDLEGLTSEQIKKLNQLDDGTYKIGVDSPTYMMIMGYCKNREIRKKLYYEYNTRAYPENIELLEKIRSLRFEIAEILGYKNYAEFDIEDSMAHNVTNVQKLIEDISEASYQKAIDEKKMIGEFAKKELFKDPNCVIEPYDVDYIYQVYESKYFNIDQEVVSEYFSVKKTISKLLAIYCQFFDINMEFIEYDDAGWKYDQSMQVIRVTEKNGDIIGDIILDLYPRAGKYSHACKSTLVGAVYQDRNDCKKSILRNIPLCVIVANFNKPTLERDGLLYFDQVNTFFHEFGHALHSVFGATRYASQSGTNVYADFVEVPSQLFEYWLLEKNIISDLSEHYKTGEKISSELIDQILYSKFFGKGLFYQRQLKLTDISLNLFLDKNLSIDTILENVDKRFVSLAHAPMTVYFLASFGHIASDLYGAKYYSYLWSLLYAIDFFYDIKEKNGLLDPRIGKALREKVLSKGSSIDPLDLIKDFLGSSFNNKNFSLYLNRFTY